MKRNWMPFVVLVVVVAAMLWLGVRRPQTGSATSVGGSGNTVRGEAAPGFALMDIRTGKKVQLSDFTGKAVLLNFWATWCPPCKEEIPWFVDLQKQYGPQGLQVIGVTMDDTNKEVISQFANDMQMNYPVLQGTEKVAEAYGGVDALPTTFYIGRDGKITKRVFGLTSHGDIENNVKFALHTTATTTAAAVTLTFGPMTARATEAEKY